MFIRVVPHHDEDSPIEEFFIESNEIKTIQKYRIYNTSKFSYFIEYGNSSISIDKNTYQKLTDFFTFFDTETGKFSSSEHN